jgi:integrase
MLEPKRYPGVRQRHRKSCTRSGSCRCPWHYIAEVQVAGLRRQETKGPFRSAAEANRERRKALADMERNPLSRRGVLVGDALDTWLARKVKSGALRPSTARAYRQHLDAYLLPILGRVKLAELTVRHLDHLQDELQRLRPDMSAATRSRVAATLRSFIRDAYRRGEVAEDPTRRAEPIKVPRKHVQVWQPEQLGRFVDWADAHGERLSPVVEVAALTGLRRGELCGLRWIDVDLVRGRIVVAQQVVQLGREQLVSAPKTAAGEQRVVDLDPDTIRVLTTLREQQDAERAEWGEDWRDFGLVFTWEDGRPFSPEDLTRRFPRLVRRFNEDPERVGVVLPVCRFHDLRHLQASLLIAANVPLAVVSKRLGHSSVQITSDTYGHLLDGVGTAAASAAAALVPRRSR